MSSLATVLLREGAGLSWPGRADTGRGNANIEVRRWLNDIASENGVNHDRGLLQIGSRRSSPTASPKTPRAHG